MDPKEIYARCFKSTDSLYPFQRETLRFLFKTEGQCLVALEMGLGKTICVLAYLMFQPQKRPVLIVCPSRLRYNWLGEFQKWFHDEAYCAQIIEHADDELLGGADFVICSYDILATQEKLKPRQHIKLSPIGQQLFERGFRQLVLDEVHTLANSKTKRTKAVLKIARHVQKGGGQVAGLSGSPIRNRPVNFFNVLSLLDPYTFYNWQYYVYQFCDAHMTHFGLKVDGASNTHELHRLIQPFYIRRTKQQVLEELPPKQHTFLPVMGIQTTAEDMVQQRQEVGLAKVPAALDFVGNFFENNPQEKLVVFAHHHAVLDQLYDSLCAKFKTLKIDGRDSEKEYREKRLLFQEDPSTQLIIVGLTGAVGYDLHAASNALFVELGYVPADINQASDRLHRLGQKNAVNIYYLVAQDTLDDHIVSILRTKTRIIGEIIEGATKNT